MSKERNRVACHAFQLMWYLASYVVGHAILHTRRRTRGSMFTLHVNGGSCSSPGVVAHTSAPCCVQLSVAVSTALASASSLANKSTDATHCVRVCAFANFRILSLTKDFLSHARVYFLDQKSLAQLLVLK